jgi:long-chain acyl-CoA synthetase
LTNPASNLVDAARAHAGRVAVRVDEATTTYSELDGTSARVAALLGQRGFKPGDRVGIMLSNVAEFAVVYYSAPRAGGVVVPMNPAAQGAGSRLLPGRLRGRAGRP